MLKFRLFLPTIDRCEGEEKRRRILESFKTEVETKSQNCRRSRTRREGGLGQHYPHCRRWQYKCAACSSGRRGPAPTHNLFTRQNYQKIQNEETKSIFFFAQFVKRIFFIIINFFFLNNLSMLHIHTHIHTHYTHTQYKTYVKRRT